MPTGVMPAVLQVQIGLTNHRVGFSTNTTYAVVGVSQGPLTWSLAFGSIGTINSSSGVFASGTSLGFFTVLVTDANGRMGSALGYVGFAVMVNPASPANQEYPNTIAFGSVGNGVPPSVFRTSFVASQATIDPATGVFTVARDAVAGTGTVTEVDAFGNTSTTSAITIVQRPSIVPATVSVALNGTQQFSVNFGSGSDVFSLVSGTGAITSGGLYTAPASGIGTTDVVRVTDNNSTIDDATITIASDLSVNPNHSPEAVLVGTQRQFIGVNGRVPYEYSLLSGGGHVDLSGLFSASNVAESGVVRVVDGVGAHADLNVVSRVVTVKSISFDGVDDYLDCGNIFNFSAASVFSVSAWVKMGGVNTSPVIGRAVDPGGGDVRGWLLLIDTQDSGATWGPLFALLNSINTDNGVFVEAATTFLSGVWTHIVATYDGSGVAAGVELYINGALMAKTVQADALVGTIQVSANTLMGQQPDVGIQLQGNLTSVSVWDSVLSASDVASLYNGGYPGDVTAHSKYVAHCLSYWILGQGDTYPNLVDAKSGHTAVMTNMIAGDIVSGDAP